MKQPHPMLTNRDLRRHKGYQKLLDLCAKEPCNRNMILDITSFSLQTLHNYFKDLLAEGYVTSEVRYLGKFKTNSIFYTTIKTVYLLEDMVPVSIKKRRIKANRLAKEPKQIEPETPPNTHARIISERHVKSNRSVESRGISSSFNMVW